MPVEYISPNASQSGGSETVDWSDIANKPTNFTTQGNTFNGAEQLLQIDSGGKIPALSGANLTALPPEVTLEGNTFNGSEQLVKTDAVGRLPALSGSLLTELPSSVTTEGNSFNGNEQLVKTDSSGRLPGLDGSQLINLPSTGGPIANVWRESKTSRDASPATKSLLTSDSVSPSSTDNVLYFTCTLAIFGSDGDKVRLLLKDGLSNAYDTTVVANGSIQYVTLTGFRGISNTDARVFKLECNTADGSIVFLPNSTDLAGTQQTRADLVIMEMTLS